MSKEKLKPSTLKSVTPVVQFSTLYFSTQIYGSIKSQMKKFTLTKLNLPVLRSSSPSTVFSLVWIFTENTV